MKAVLAVGLLIAGTPLFAAELKKLTVEELQGTWLFDAASRASMTDSLATVWTSKLIVKDKTFAVEKFLGLKVPLKGTLELDPAEKVGHIDLAMEEFDLKDLSFHAKIPPGTLAGVYSRDGNRIRFCFHSEPGGERPKSVDDAGKKLFAFTLAKAPKDFRDFPKEIVVKVTTPDGKPAKGVPIGSRMDKGQNEKTKEFDGKWTLPEPKTTDAKGESKFEYAAPELMAQSVIAWDEANKLIGFGSTSPASVAGKPEMSIRLGPVCNVTLNITCDALKKSGLTDTFHCQAITESGHWIAFNASKSGRLDFLLPAGEYKLMIYGSTFLGTKHVRMTIPGNRSEYAAPEFEMEATGLLTLLGKPAPELAEVIGWKGDAVKLADLKGKVVLLEFWGYLCGPCIGAMPGLMELHEKFADKGLVIIGVHVDGDGEVDTAAKLDAKIAVYKKKRFGKGRISRSRSRSHRASATRRAAIRAGRRHCTASAAIRARSSSAAMVRSSAHSTPARVRAASSKWRNC